MSEWYDNGKKSNSNFRKLLQDKMIKLIQNRFKLFLDAFLSKVTGHHFAEWEQIK